MTELEKIQHGIDAIVATNKVLTDSINRRFDQMDKDINALYDAKDDHARLIAQQEVSISLLKQLRDESREDLKEARAEMTNLREEIMLSVKSSFASKDQQCQEFHREMDNKLDFKATELHQSFSEKVSEVSKRLGISGSLKVSNLQVWILVGACTVAGSIITFLITQYVVK